MTYPYAAFSPVGPYFDAEFAMAWVGGYFWDGRVPDLSTQAQAAVYQSGRDEQYPHQRDLSAARGGLFRPRRSEGPELSIVRPALHSRSTAADAFTKYTVPELYTLITRSR